MPQSNRILITGANGLLGRRLVSSLARQYDVHAIVREMPENAVDGVTYHSIDLGREWGTELLPAGVETVFHLAQSTHFRDFPSQAMDVFRVNVDSTARLLDYSQKSGVRRFVYASSGGVYGAGSHVIHENSPITPHGQLGYYLGSKLCSEILVENYAAHMLVNVIRFFFIYGPEQKRSMLIPRLVDSVRDGRPIQLQGRDGISINPLHVSDAVKALEKIMSLEQSATFNMAGPQVLSLREIANIAGKAIGRDPVFQEIPGEGKNLVADIGEMKSQLIAPALSLADAMDEMIPHE